MSKTGPKPRTPAERVLSHVSYDCGCWVPSKLIGSNGYARVSVMRDGKWRAQMAHRAVYEELVCPIGKLSLDHRCRNPACVNPLHLDPVSHQENVRRGTSATVWKSRSHCKNGHPFDESNTRYSNGSRVCMECRRRFGREYKRRRYEETGKWPR